MAEYIEREAALEFQDKIEPELFCKNLNGERMQSCSETFSASNLIRFIRSIPAADVVAVRHGRWISGKCDQCGEHAPYWCLATTYYKSNYCPNCGAKMDGGVNDV
jgi:hypothetical protein